MLGVSLDRSREPWIQALKADGLAWTQVSDLQYWNNEAARKYKIESIPQNFTSSTPMERSLVKTFAVMSWMRSCVSCWDVNKVC